MEAATQREWLRLLRDRLGLTAQGLADRLGVSRMTIHRWETGRANSRPNLDHARELAKLAETSVDEVARIFAPAAA